MENREILANAIDKAITNEFKFNSEITNYESMQTYRTIFSHPFAKAFWGKDKITTSIELENEGIGLRVVAWQYHLQQMVLEIEPLKYLEKFL